jgi:hypothetical protein
MTDTTARIVWLSASEGGRKTPPSGARYIAPALFVGRLDLNSWSLVVDLLVRFSDPTEWIATVRFLSPEAPSELLSDGARFELMEGSKRVAIGTVGSAAVPEGPAGVPAAQEVGR